MLHQWLIGAGAAFLAGLVQGCTGFGMALVAAPALMLIVEPRVAVPIVVSMSTINTAVVAWSAREHIRRAIVLPVAAGGVIGFPAGLLVLKHVDPQPLKLAVATGLVLFGTALLAGWRHPVKREKRALMPVGLLSGFLGGCTSIGGPPIILFLTNQNIPKNVFRASIVTYFLCINVFGMVLYAAAGLLTARVLTLDAAALPLMLSGTWCGIHLSRRVPEEVFRRIATGLVVVMGLMLLLRNLHGEG